MYIPVTPEILEAMAQMGYASAAENLAAQHGITLPKPFTFDGTLDEFAAQMPELERRLIADK